MLELRKIIRMSYLVTCPSVFLLFYERDWQKVVFKVIRNDHLLVFLAV